MESTDASLRRRQVLPQSEDSQSPPAAIDSPLFLPFVRDDRYGDVVVGPHSSGSILRRLQLAVASITILPLRAALLVWLVCVFYAVCRLATIFHPLHRLDEGREVTYATQLRGVRRAIIVLSGRLLSRAVLFVLGFHRILEIDMPELPPSGEVLDANGMDAGSAPVQQGQGEEPGGRQQRRGQGGRPACVVSNHVSWVDILYHMYAHARGLPCFAAKQGVAALPLLGFVSRCLGCIYVQREGRGPASTGSAALLIARLRAAERDPVAPMPLLFPEGTTSNGRWLLPFRSGAFLTGAPVLPVLLAYPHPPGAVSPAWESISAKRHLFFMLCTFSHTLVVRRFPVYFPSAREMEEPKLYAENVRRLLSAQGGLQLSDATLYDKRVYHALLRSEEPPPPPSQKRE